MNEIVCEAFEIIPQEMIKVWMKTLLMKNKMYVIRALLPWTSGCSFPGSSHGFSLCVFICLVFLCKPY